MRNLTLRLSWKQLPWCHQKCNAMAVGPNTILDEHKQMFLQYRDLVRAHTAQCLPSGNLIRFDEVFNSDVFVSDWFFEVSITYENI